MPNWVHNSVTITGPAEEIDRFKAVFVQSNERSGDLDFPSIIPLPPDCEDGREHWGTRFAVGLDVTEDEKGYHFSFDSPSEPPWQIWDKIGEVFPRLDFELFCDQILT